MNSTLTPRGAWRLLAPTLTLALFAPLAAADELKMHSPDHGIEVRLDIGATLTYQVFHDGKELLASSPLSLTVGGWVFGHEPQLSGLEKRRVDVQLKPVVRVKSEGIHDLHDEYALSFLGGCGLVFRIYDDSIAYRWTTELGGEITVDSEEVVFNFPGDHRVWFPEEESLLTHSERLYVQLPLTQIDESRFCSLPALVDTADGPRVLITEADLYDYPGLYLRGTGAQGLHGLHPGVALQEEQTNDRTVEVREYADYIAKTSGTRSFPWRVLVIAEEDGDLLTDQTVWKLSSPLRLEDPSWIRPGKVAWDWYNYNNVFDVDFRAGVNTETYEFYIDFAADHGLEYIILDEGWYPLGSLLKTTPDIDVDALFEYAEERGVGIILWVVWKTLDDQLEPALDKFERWGAKGIKVDFMQRDDQWMVNYYERIAKAAAERKLLVDFHGSYKPAGLRRAYPNVITREGVKGLENNKWSKDITPAHNVTLPFIRMVAGPMDYTPGAMVNAQPQNFQPVFRRPMSQGTRCHQLAMYVVFESPLQMLADSPSLYLREQECMHFLSAVPTVWDDTRVLSATVGEHVLLARRSGQEWYVGAMTDGSARKLNVDLSFLGAGEYELHAWGDGLNADRFASDYRYSKSVVSVGQSVTIELAPGGGWAARLVPVR